MDDDEAEGLIRPGGGMFDYRQTKADMAANVAIQILADGGWAALTLRNMANEANVTPQAIAAWFPSVTVMRAAIADRYGERWIRERYVQARRRLIRPLGSTEPVTVAQVAVALVPTTWREGVFATLWHTIVEASRWDDAVGAVVAALREEERDMVLGLLNEVECRDEAQREEYADLVLALTAPPGAMSYDRRGQVIAAVLSAET